MDFVDCCSFLLNKLIEDGRNPHIDRMRLAQIVYGDEIFVRHGSQIEAPTQAELDALIAEGTSAR